MTVNVYAVRDLVAKSFNQPWVDVNDEVAMRGFAQAINNNSIMGFRPADFQLYQIGEFDTEKGDLQPILPILLARGDDVVAD